MVRMNIFTNHRKNKYVTMNCQKIKNLKTYLLRI